ncbi:outer membrane protein assembly factor BamE [Legionella lytica]|jgi:outer membrane protein assembly factor BamE|uniref:Outer membrane protein assembly factor BamE n=1 Tax=Legionella lytica TaxID=96232 RepID=A0ABY4Y8Y3_9GAMM|nr:outer membrane protein assembly factor BamE [Legionella lytica]USQ14066.1 outer membrane protein assembly factor BamE [Legionella lytica]
MAKFFTVGKKMRIIALLLGILCTLTLTQCTSFDFARRIAQQGNLLPESKLKRLKVGMSKNDVAILMGTSLLSPTFNNDRWDYAYTWRRGHGNMTMKRVSLYFSHGTLKRIERI